MVQAVKAAGLFVLEEITHQGEWVMCDSKKGAVSMQRFFVEPGQVDEAAGQILICGA